MKDSYTRQAQLKSKYAITMIGMTRAQADRFMVIHQLTATDSRGMHWGMAPQSVFFDFILIFESNIVKEVIHCDQNLSILV